MKQDKLIKNEENRRIKNHNMIIQQDIERMKDNIDEYIGNKESVMRQNKVTKDDINTIYREFENVKKHVFYLEEQNINLELELDKFLVSDNEIRAKL